MYTVTYSKERSNANRATWLVTQPGQGRGKTRVFAVHHNAHDAQWWAERLGPTTGRPDVCGPVQAKQLVRAVKLWHAAFGQGAEAYREEPNPYTPGTVLADGWSAGYDSVPHVSWSPEVAQCGTATN